MEIKKIYGHIPHKLISYNKVFLILLDTRPHLPLVVQRCYCWGAGSTLSSGPFHRSWAGARWCMIPRPPLVVQTGVREDWVIGCMPLALLCFPLLFQWFAWCIATAEYSVLPGNISRALKRTRCRARALMRLTKELWKQKP